MYLLTVEDATGSSAYELVNKLYTKYDGAVKGALSLIRDMAIDRGEQDAVEALDALAKAKELDEDVLTEIAEETLGDTYFRIEELDIEE